MKTIKTIAICNNAKEFDRQVNAALEDGFQLVRRYATSLTPTWAGPDKVTEPTAVYYAELEKTQPSNMEEKSDDLEKMLCDKEDTSIGALVEKIKQEEPQAARKYTRNPKA